MLKRTQEDSVRTFLVLAVEDLLPKLFAWAYRDAKYSGVIAGVDPDAVKRKKLVIGVKVSKKKILYIS